MKASVRLSVIAVTLMSLGLITAPVNAQVIVGFTAGQSNIGDYEFDATDTNRDTDDSDTAYGIFLGYRFNDFLALTAGYTDLGSLEVAATSAAAVPFTDKIDAEALDFSAIGILPFRVFAGDGGFLSRFALFVQVGLAFWNQDVNCVACDGGADFKGGDSGTTGVYGGGLNVNFTDQLGVHVRYASYGDIGSDETGHKQDWDMWGLGATWSFGD